jgi:ubiquinone/menaquinone biosynthesis C-methylase UbiE
MNTQRRDPSLSSRQRREQQFHDASAGLSDPHGLRPRAPDWWAREFESAVLERVGPLAGARVLELGCGDGELTLRLAESGAAHVTAIDVSPAMVALAEGRMKLYRPGAPVDFAAVPAEDTALLESSFDVAVGKWILHHVELEPGLAELHRVLRPGGRGVFIETSAFNPLLVLARRFAAGRVGTRRYGTSDERPLTRRDIRLMRRTFRDVSVDFPNFWLTVLVPRALDYRFPRLNDACEYIDDLLARRSRLGWLSYYLRVAVMK